jgi:addiction module HigA family antidote
MMEQTAPIHPGEILKKEFLEPLGMSQLALAKSINVSARRINETVLKKRGITADTALKLARYFRVTPEFWMNLQVHFDLETQKDKLAGALKKIKQISLKN